jgi:hypothetical protein
MRQIVFLATLIMSYGVFGFSQDTPERLQVTSIFYDHKEPLTAALRIVGLHLKGGFVSFGVDIGGNAEPEVDVSMPETTLGDALRRITSQAPGYGSEVVSNHVIEIYGPADRSANQDDPLDLPIREFSVKDVPAMMILSSPPRYLPDLKSYLSKQHNEVQCGSIGPGLGSDAMGVTLFMTGRTVRQILDAVAEADASLPNSQRFRMEPAGWVYRRKHDPKLGVIHTWSPMSFAPHDWRLYVAK